MTRLRQYGTTLPLIAAAVLLAHGMQPYFDQTNVAMVYLLAVVVAAFLLGLGPAILTCLLSVFLFDFVNLPPYFGFSDRAGEYLFTLGVMLVTAVIISGLAGRLRQKVAESADREARTAALYALSAELAEQQGNDDVVRIALCHIAEAFQAEVDLLYPGQSGPGPIAWPFDRPAVSVLAPDQVLTMSQGGRVRACCPLHVDSQLHALVLLQSQPRWLGQREQTAHLQAMVRLAAQAMERNNLRRQIHASELRIQQEQLRNSILNAISHDMRTPLATIHGASSSLMEEGDRFSPAARYRLRAMIYDESLHMQRMVENLLDLARLQSGQIVLGREWQAIEEIVGSAVAVLKRRSKLRAVQVDVPADLPLIRCDSTLLERVLVNLLENADRYSPADTVITVQADVFEGKLRLMIIDQGVGIPPEEQEKVFDPFYRLGQRGTGFGLGLTICRTIIEASGGEIWLRSTVGAGTTVCLALPIPADAPAMQPESGLGPEA